jgi:hypothetical protein
MKVATVLDNSDPFSIMRRHRGIISVCSKKLITSGSSIFTKAPTTPSEVRRRYSNGLALASVFKNGYKYKGMCADKNNPRVSGCDATHCKSASALHTRLEQWAVKVGGLSNG